MSNGVKAVLGRLGRWVGIDVLASLAPLGAAALVRLAKGNPVTLDALIGDGELLLVTIAVVLPVVAAVVMSDMNGGLRAALAIPLLLSLGAAALLYGSFASQDSPSMHFVVTTSIILWGVLLVVGGTGMAALPRSPR